MLTKTNSFQSSVRLDLVFLVLLFITERKSRREANLISKLVLKFGANREPGQDQARHDSISTGIDDPGYGKINSQPKS